MKKIHVNFAADMARSIVVRTNLAYEVAPVHKIVIRDYSQR
jgi:hypothetical protein